MRTSLALRRRSRLFGCFLLLLSASCYRQVVRQIFVTSEPSGAKIEVDGEYVGDAPVTVSVPIKCTWVGLAYSSDGYGLSWEEKLRTIHLRALPSISGQYTQFKDLDIEKVFQKDVTRVYFDMRLEPVPNRYEYDIHNH
jgi:hypothetical protein